MPKYAYNLKPDQVDMRDYKFSEVLCPAAGTILPRVVNISGKMPPIFDQKVLGSCTANAGSAAMNAFLNDPNINLSRLYLYYKEREEEGTINEDAGASMRTIGKILAKSGICLEEFMPYIISNYNIVPSAAAELDAATRKARSYYKLGSIQQIKECLALKQIPVMIGMYVFPSFESIGTSGKLIMPAAGDQNLGGHAVLIVGYEDRFFNKGYFIVRNSWGTSWGDKGYFYMPYEYIMKNYAFDFWVVS